MFTYQRFAIRRENKPPRLLLPRAKFEGLGALGAAHVGLLRFNARLASMNALDFATRVLRERLQAREVWVGPEFRFGRGRTGDLALLRELGFEAHEIAPVEHAGERVSSSRIRAALVAGDLATAAEQLGRPYSIGGKVVHGQQLGRQLGYPTANIRLGRRLAPLQGIFAVRVHGIGGVVRPGVASLGVRPTVTGVDPQPLLEAHLFDFDGDLYGCRISVEFVEKLRDEEKFPDLASMVRQIDHDAAAARRILGVAAVAAAGA